jgi:hypothetical protein
MSKYIETTLDITADRQTRAYSLEHVRRVGIKIECPTGDIVGNFKVQTRCGPNAGWDDHPTFTAAKASGNTLSARFDWPTNCGWQMRVAFVHGSGTTPATGCMIYISLT